MRFWEKKCGFLGKVCGKKEWGQNYKNYVENVEIEILIGYNGTEDLFSVHVRVKGTNTFYNILMVMFSSFYGQFQQKIRQGICRMNNDRRGYKEIC